MDKNEELINEFAGKCTSSVCANLETRMKSQCGCGKKKRGNVVFLDPVLRTFAKSLYKDPDIGDFLMGLPHHYFDENQVLNIYKIIQQMYFPCIW